MTEDKSDFNKLTAMDRRKFLSGLLAVGAASSVLPVGVNEAVDITNDGLPLIVDIETRTDSMSFYQWQEMFVRVTLVDGKVVKSELIKLTDMERDDAGNDLLTT